MRRWVAGLMLVAPLMLRAADNGALLHLPIAELQARMAAGSLTAEALTRTALSRIKAGNPSLHAVIAVNPDALAQARGIDAMRRKGADLGPMMGIPVLIKDNIETKDRMATTAGSLALKDNVTLRDAPVVARLRAAGAVIIGKANLSEWANIRSSASVSGWSAVGGLTANPHDPRRNACGSSSGSGSAVAADLAVIAVGTETDGSVICPSSVNGVVGLKPTVGLVSRSRVVPISHSQDTPGPMGHSVRDVALMLNAMAGGDPEDSATAEADAHKTDYAANLGADALKGVRIGVMRDQITDNWKIAELFDKALDRLRHAGAELVDLKDTKIDMGDAEIVVLLTELKADLNAYLATTPPAVKTRTLADLIAFNRDHAAAEMPYFRQELFERAEKTMGLDDPDYVAAHDKARTLSANRLDQLMRDNEVALLVAPSKSPAWLSDLVNGDRPGGPSVTKMPATSGYPHLTVPMGMIQGLPVGLSILGPKWGEAALLQAGYAFEQSR
jgi:amidase